MRKLILTTAAVAAAIWLAGCPKTLTREPVSETRTEAETETDTVAGMITDERDGQKYKTVRMRDGNIWMAQNLNYKTDSSWCYADSCKKYGRLYAWTAAMNACPAGYRLPSDTEWDSLLEAVGGYDAAGKKLKSKSGWNSYDGKNANGTDDYGFSALPGGYRFPPVGSNDTAGYFGFWWAAGGNRYVYYMNHYNDAVYVSFHDKGIAHSVRCVEDSVKHEYGTLADARDGQTYRTIKIGKQTWMAQNLNYQTDSSWCYYDDTSYCEKYGRLYDWNAAKTACPAGYHLPSSQEWDSLAVAAGGKRASRTYYECGCDCESIVFYWDGAANKLKSRRGWDWDDDDIRGHVRDDYGFSALPGGHRKPGDRRSIYDRFDYERRNGVWWTATEQDSGSGNAYHRYMGYDFYNVGEGDHDKRFGLSVRCVANSARGTAPLAAAEVVPVAAVEPSFGTFTDERDGQTYKTVKIGGQIWMAQNLNYKTDNSWCYRDDTSDCNKYGRLYDWKTAKTVCPAGWKLPDTADWRTLVRIAGGWKTAGKKLKSKSGWNWNDDNNVNGNGTDNYGFSALPGGTRTYNDLFEDVGEEGNWWTTTEDNISGGAYCVYIYYRNDRAYSPPAYKYGGYSVRCVTDNP